MKTTNQIITIIVFWGFLVILNYAQEIKSFPIDFSTLTLDSIETNVDSIDIVRSNGSKERQIYLFDLSNGKFTEIYKSWNSTNWINNWRHVYYYGIDKKITSRCGDTWNGSTWIPSWCYKYEYDDVGNLISETLENFRSNTATWVNIKRSLETYNIQNQMILRLDQNWNGAEWKNKWQAEYGYDIYGNRNYLVSGDYANDIWIKQLRTNITFDKNGNRLLYQVEKSNGSDEWKFDLSIVRTFNINSDILTEARDKWNNEQWENDYFISYYYNELNNLISEVYGYYKDTLWNNIYRISYEYDLNGKKISDFMEQWDTTAWKNNSRATYEYDDNANLVFKLTENHFKGYWDLFHREIFEYEENKLIKSIYENYSEGSWYMSDGFFEFYGSPGLKFYIIGAIINFYHNDVTNINSTYNPIARYFLDQNYPNPFNPSTTINYSIPEDGLVTIKVYDILGREVITLVNEEKQPGNYKVKFNGDNLSSGIYLYKMTANDFVEVKKFVLTK